MRRASVTLTFGGWDISMEADGGEALLTPVRATSPSPRAPRPCPCTRTEVDADPFAKSGIIVRETPLAESRYVAMFDDPGHGLRSAHRRMFNTGQTWDNGAPNATADLPLTSAFSGAAQMHQRLHLHDGTTFIPKGDVETVDYRRSPAKRCTSASRAPRAAS